MYRLNFSSSLAKSPLPPSRFALGKELQVGALCAAAVAALLTPSRLAAQDQSAETFSLPTPSPTPTAAPQGPEDERVGVPIAPRVIPQDQPPNPAPTPIPTPPPAPASSTNQAANEGSTSAARTSPAQSTPSPTSSSSVPQTSQPSTTRAQPAERNAPNVLNPNPQGAGIAVEDPTGPGFESLGEETEGAATRSPDGSYSVDEAGSETVASSAAIAPPLENTATSTPRTASLWYRLSAQSELLMVLIALITALGGVVAVVLSRRKRENEETLEAQAAVLKAGVRASLGEDGEAAKGALPVASEPTAPIKEAVAIRKPEPEPELEMAPTIWPANSASPEPAAIASVASTAVKTAPKPPAPASALVFSPTPSAPATSNEPLKVDLALEITSASRSLMRLTLDFSLEITNRSTELIKNLNIAGELACAQEGSAGPAPVDKTKAITEAERIAPQQSRRVKGTLQLPIQEITTIKQNGRPVVIPLVHFRLGVPGRNPIKRTFVVGTPSASNPTRVHPLMLDGPPGSLARLRAQLIKQS